MRLVAVSCQALEGTAFRESAKVASVQTGTPGDIIKILDFLLLASMQNAKNSLGF